MRYALFFLLLLCSAIATAHNANGHKTGGHQENREQGNTSKPASLSPQLVDAYNGLVAMDKRLATTGYRLAKANAAFCENKMRNAGIVFHDLHQYPDRKLAEQIFAFRSPVAISAMVDGGPADNAGMQVGAGLLALNNVKWAWPDDGKDRQTSDRLAMVRKTIRATSISNDSYTLTLKTQKGEAQFALSPPLVCASDFIVSTGNIADAGANGEIVRVSAKLMEFTPDADEFAFIVAHEFAHNILEHRKWLDSQNVKRGIGRMFGKSKKLFRATEVEADRMAIWMMANAGYNVQAAPTFIERFGRKYGRGIFSDGTHYRWKKRQSIMQDEIAALSKVQRSEQGYDFRMMQK